MNDKWCPHCRRQIPNPGTLEMHKYAKYWRDNRCYYCDSELATTYLEPSVINQSRPSAFPSQGRDYICDICNTEMPSKARYFFDENRVRTSPSYWEYLYTDTITSVLLGGENNLGYFLNSISASRGGFTVCDKCRKMLRQDGEKAREYGIEGFVSSLPSGQVDTHAMGIVAGTVWKRIHGKWPSTIQIGGGPGGSLIVKRKGYKQQGKWWQFWK